MQPKMSICITVYNQINILRWCLDEILKYKGNDIQVVVSDNYSSDDIKGCIEGFADKRIKYCKTEKNIGQDGNIINGIKNCDSDYVFLLRTRDTILHDKISMVLRAINQAPDSAYWRFSALNENGYEKYTLKDNDISKGKQAIRAHFELLIHPSGELFNMRYVSLQELDEIDSHIRLYFPENNGYLSHVLIRELLSNRGNFMTISEPVWIYSDTIRATDVAVNSEPSRRNPYSPYYEYKRYSCEMKYAIMSFDDEDREELVKRIVEKYCSSITYDFKAINDSEGYRRHYNCAKENYSRRNERKRFVKFSKENFEYCDANIKTIISRWLRAVRFLHFPSKN